MHGSGYAPIVWKALATGVVVAAVTVAIAVGGDLDPLDAPKAPAAAGGLDDLAGGGTLFRVSSVQAPTKALAEGLFRRTFEGRVAASTWPARFVLDDKDLIAPVQIVDKATEEIRTIYPITGRRALSAGKHTLLPGSIEITADEKTLALASNHPAVRIDATTVNIVCAAVRIEARDAAGTPVPTAVQLWCGDLTLLRDDKTLYNPLIIHLPVGVTYKSSFGEFAVSPEGKIAAGPAGLARDVKLTAGGLCRTVEAPKAVAAPAAGPIPRVLPHAVGGKTLKVFVEPIVAPGEPAWLAISKKACQESTGRPPALEAVTFSADVKQQLATGRGGPATPPPAALVERAAAELAAPATDLAWVRVPLPASALAGPAAITVVEPSLGAIKRTVWLADAGAAMYLMPHRLRTAFADTEEAPFAVVIRGGFAGGEAAVLCRPADAPADAAPMELGRLALPAVAAGQMDSRTFTVRMADLPEGHWRLWVRSAGQAASQPVAVQVVSLRRRSSFLIHAMAACGGTPDTTDDGVRRLSEVAAYEMFTSGGFESPLGAAMPAIDPAAAESLRQADPTLPPELAWRPARCDAYLETFLRHRVRHVDFYFRSHAFYMEGLSYYHSFKPSVDRMVRRLQVFTEQVAEYPSMWGVNTMWFPQLGGYAEGGLDTDIHKRDRNAALARKLEEAGLKPLTKDELAFYEANKFSADAPARQRAAKLMLQAVAHWKGQQGFGWGVHNEMYNAAIRQVRGDLKCVLYENAGHDARKRTSDLFGGMDAVTYESYSDYPEWPMSAAFTTDWARGNCPGKPVWVTIDLGSTPEGEMKSLLHAVGRGVSGSGMLMPADMPAQTFDRKGAGLRFVSQYGPIALKAAPDGRFAILATAGEQVLGNANGGAQYAYHAIYWHLSRLGCPPIIVADENFAARGAPAGVKALFIVRQQQPLEAKVAAAIEAFQAAGGKVVVTGDCLVKVPGAIVAAGQVKTIWDLGGFTAHAPLWEEFARTWRGSLGEAIAATGVAPAATTDSDRGLVLTTDAGPVRYAVVLPEDKGAVAYKVSPVEKLPVSLEGAGWIVRDLARQTDVPTAAKDGRTQIAVDLVTEPGTLLALYKAPPASVELRTGADPRLGGTLAFTAEVRDAGAQPMGAVPMKYEVTGPAGRVLDTLFRTAGQEVEFALPARQQPGPWKLLAQELLTGRCAAWQFTPAAAVTTATVHAVGAVHVPQAEQVRQFLRRPGPKRIIVEPGQQRLGPLAARLAERLNAAGVQADVWQVGSEEFDTIPLRWYPRADDDAPRLADVEAGKVIGVRQGLKPYIDKKRRAHVPEKGGYEEIDPPYMVAADCIVLAGGRLAESLRAVTAWMGTPNVPGRGQGRLVVCYSPFTAGRAALALVANDDAGLAAAATELAAQATAPTAAAQPAVVAAQWRTQVTGTAAQVVPTPYVGYAPVQRTLRLLANRAGAAAVVLDGKKDNLAFVDASGKVTATVAAAIPHVAQASLDGQGRYWDLAARHLGGEWYHQEITRRGIGPDGGLLSEMTVFSGSVFFDNLPTDWQGGYAVSPDGSAGAVAAAGGLWLGRAGQAGRDAWTFYDDVPHVYQRHGLRHPRVPVGLAFSPDGGYLLCTMDTRPPGWGNMNQPAEHPTVSETILLDAATARCLWRLRDEADYRSARYAVHTGFAALSVGGAVAAFADYAGSAFLVDRDGHVLFEQRVAPKLPERYHLGPMDGVGVWMDDAAALAAFGYRNLLVLVDVKARSAVRVPVPGLRSACVASDGALAVVACDGGRIRAFDSAGREKWTASPGGIGSHVAAIGGGQTLAATSEGELVLLDSAGKELRRTGVWKQADAARHELARSGQYQPLAGPPAYRDPLTLELARKHLSARQIAAWAPPGAAAATQVAGKAFHPVVEPIVLTAAAPGKEAFLHLVYRRPEGNKSLAVTTNGSDGDTFVLDLPTPLFRVVDIPLRGASPKVTVAAEGPVEVAECSLWSFRWAGTNVAFVPPPSVEPAGPGGPGIGDEPAPAADGLLSELPGAKAVAGTMKECRIWATNPDIDKVAGPWLKPPIDALRMVDGKRFGNDKLPPWNVKPFIGAAFTVNLGRPMPLSMVATYDRVRKQSALSVNIAVFTERDGKETVRAGAVANDQFWRVFVLSTADPATTLGVHVFSGQADGLSEIEAYCPAVEATERP